MAKSTIPEPATGVVGFGCGFLLSAIAIIASTLPETAYDLAVAIAAAVVLGLLTARFGEPFLERLLAFLR